MSEYLVTWAINVEADSPEEAAELALEIQRDPESIATVFTTIPQSEDGQFYRVNAKRIDLEVVLEEANVH